VNDLWEVDKVVTQEWCHFLVWMFYSFVELSTLLFNPSPIIIDPRMSGTNPPVLDHYDLISYFPSPYMGKSHFKYSILHLIIFI